MCKSPSNIRRSCTTLPQRGRGGSWVHGVGGGGGGVSGVGGRWCEWWGGWIMLG